MSGCDIYPFRDTKSSSKKSISPSNAPKQFAILGPLSDANVTFYDYGSNAVIYTTKTKTLANGTEKLVWGKYSVGSFEVDNNLSTNSSDWIRVEISSGEDVDSNDDKIIDDVSTQLIGKAELLCKISDINSTAFIVNIFTTLGVEFYLHDINTTTLDKEDYLDKFAKSIFSQSVDEHSGVDYRDLFAYIPNHTPNTYLKTANIYKKLVEYKIMESILNGDDVVSKLREDSDGDGLDLWQEILHNTSPNAADTDGDGLLDADEIQQGLNPASDDSDFDGLKDNEEKLYGTSATNSDSDEDYKPDYQELLSGTDPLEADEDGNGIADGLDGDPFFKYQWYLKSLGDIVTNTANASTIIGNDLSILDVYHKVLGNSSGVATIVQVVDTGVELVHEDLDVDLSDSFNAVTHANDPTATNGVSKSDPTSPLNSGHGTAVAGIIAAKTNNGLGIRGIVPRAKIAGSNWLENQSLGELDRVWYSQVNDDNISVSNNSWGAYYLKDESFERILALGTSQLRYGRGRIYTFAAGNARETYGNANLSYLTNNPYAITVASLNADDKYASYSNPGSNILVSAYGGEHYYTGPTIMTTSLSGDSYYESELNGRKGVITVDEDSNKSYTYAMNGTSAATPMVSGSIALVLDACPTLSWRDVRWLIAHTATQVDKMNTSWITNAAGLHFSIDYGYGKINPLKMIENCRSQYFQPLPQMEHAEVIKEYNAEIPDTNTTIIKKLNFEKAMKIEWVGLTVDTSHPFAGDLEINLISPSGTKINIISPNELRYAAYKDGFRFSSVGYIDEDSKGEWRVEITDRLPNDSGVLKSLKLEVYGYEK